MQAVAAVERLELITRRTLAAQRQVAAVQVEIL
jgi:hypothetical protein